MTGTQCVFCRIVKGSEPAYTVWQNDLYLAFLDKYPRTRGHMQLIPKTHYRFVYDIPDMGGIFAVAQKIIRVIIPVLGASHVTLGAFGHEVHHAHIWIVPQYGSNVKLEEGMRPRTTDDQALLARKLSEHLSKEV